jgi:hypothetical protein
VFLLAAAGWQAPFAAADTNKSVPATPAPTAPALTAAAPTTAPPAASDPAPSVTLDSVAPATDYRAPNREGYNFVMAGHNLAKVATDNIVIVVGQGPLSVGSPDQCANLDAMNKSRKICLSYDPGMEGMKLNVTNYRPPHNEGPVSFALQVGNNISTAQKITFSRVHAKTLRWMAVGIFFGLAGIVFALVYGGIKQSRLAGESTSVLMAFFLDRQTNSFSLSKFQVIAWTVVAVFSYVYLFLCHIFIQWTFTFPPVPDGLPTLLGLSAGTTVFALGITANRGSKGAGPIHPSLADFVSTGGLVAGERFQYFVWTLVGCLGFLAIILRTDPASLTELPSIPATFLTLMGVSSAGYLAGKLVRQPGPIIQLLTVTEVIAQDDNHPAVMKMLVKGQNLSDRAVVKIDQKELRIGQFTIVGTTRQDQPANSPFYTSLEIDLLDAEMYRTGTHLLYLVNEDGQSTCECFPMNALLVNPVAPMPLGAGPLTVNLVGANFAAGFQAAWVDANTRRYIIPADDIHFVDVNHLNVTFTPVMAGAGELVLETQANLQAIVPIVIT